MPDTLFLLKSQYGSEKENQNILVQTGALNQGIASKMQHFKHLKFSNIL